MIRIEKANEYVILHYSSEIGDANWLATRLGLIDTEGHHSSYEQPIIAHTFQITKDLYINTQKAINSSTNTTYIQSKRSI